MLRMHTVSSPTLAAGVFSIVFGEFAGINNDDGPGAPITSDTAATPTILPMKNTTGFAVGQTVLVEDAVGHTDTGVISVVTPGVSITVSAPLVNTYLVANYPTVTVIQPRVSVAMTNPFTDLLDFAMSWKVSGNQINITVQAVSIDAGPDFSWAAATTGEVAGVVFTVEADGQ